jgi:hypothetical protein
VAVAADRERWYARLRLGNRWIRPQLNSGVSRDTELVTHSATLLAGRVAFLASRGGRVPRAVAPRPRPARRTRPGAAPRVGVGLLLWCVRDFYVAGRGSLAPWAPPRGW